MPPHMPHQLHDVALTSGAASALTRTATAAASDRSRARNATTSSRACSFASAATESSRSTTISSASSPIAFASIRSEDPGTDNEESTGPLNGDGAHRGAELRRPRADADRGSQLRQARRWHGVRQSATAHSGVLSGSSGQRLADIVRSWYARGALGAPPRPRRRASRLAPTRRTAGCCCGTAVGGNSIAALRPISLASQEGGEDRCRRTKLGRLGSSQGRRGLALCRWWRSCIRRSSRALRRRLARRPKAITDGVAGTVYLGVRGV
jgi:hypothetical protein